MTRNSRIWAVVVAALVASGVSAQQPVGTAFTYQGQLKQAGLPANGSYDLSLSLWDAATGGAQCGSTVALPGVPVTDGLFTVALEFGADCFATNAARWLQVAVGGTTLAPRQPLMPTPFALSTRGVTVAPNGAVGLGTAAPSARLHVSASGEGAYNLGLFENLNPPGSPLGVGAFLTLVSQETAPNAYLGSIGFSSAGANVPSQFAFFNGSTPGRSQLSFVTSGSNRMRIDEDGLVGIGTTAPGAPLHVVGPGGGSLAARFGATTGINGIRFDGASAGGGNVSTSFGFYDNGQPISTWQLNANSSATMYNSYLALQSTIADQRIEMTNTGSGGHSWWLISTSQGSGVQPGSFRIYDATAGVDRIVCSPTGNVGIGKTSPAARLDVFDPVGSGRHGLNILANCDAGFATMRVHSDHNPDPSRTLMSVSQQANTHMIVRMDGRVGIGTTAPEARLHVIGTTRTGVVEITGGSDLAEPFDVSPSEETETHPMPGMLVVIDPRNPGKLRVATEPYDRKLAGAISGANGLSPGMMMKAEGSVHAEGEHPVALVGRVWCYADASTAAIAPGDLLTTSATPGHAMRVGDDADVPRGCILGKAMTPLNDGSGLVLVLVNLQ